MKKRDEYIQSLYDSATIMNEQIDQLQREIDELSPKREKLLGQVINEAAQQELVFRNGKYRKPRNKLELHWATAAIAPEHEAWRSLSMKTMANVREINKLKRMLKIINNTLKALGGDKSHE